jgi:hypothetical protein
MTLFNQEMYDLIDDVFRVSNIKLLTIAPFPDNAAVLTTLQEIQPKSKAIQEQLKTDACTMKRTQVFSFQTLLNSFEKSTSVTFLTDLQNILAFLNGIETHTEEPNGEEVSDNGDPASDNDDNTPT